MTVRIPLTKRRPEMTERQRQWCRDRIPHYRDLESAMAAVRAKAETAAQREDQAA